MPRVTVKVWDGYENTDYLYHARLYSGTPSMTLNSVGE